MDSRVESGDSDDDYVIKDVVVRAERHPDDSLNEYDLVAYIAVECTEVHHDLVEAYRIPFPECQSLRFEILRLIRRQPRYSAN
jgi:hypothetical protein